MIMDSKAEPVHDPQGEGIEIFKVLPDEGLLINRKMYNNTANTALI